MIYKSPWISKSLFNLKKKIPCMKYFFKTFVSEIWICRNMFALTPEQLGMATGQIGRRSQRNGQWIFFLKVGWVPNKNVTKVTKKKNDCRIAERTFGGISNEISGKWPTKLQLENRERIAKNIPGLILKKEDRKKFNTLIEKFIK